MIPYSLASSRSRRWRRGGVKATATPIAHGRQSRVPDRRGVRSGMGSQHRPPRCSPQDPGKETLKEEAETRERKEARGSAGPGMSETGGIYEYRIIQALKRTPLLPKLLCPLKAEYYSSTMDTFGSSHLKKKKKENFVSAGLLVQGPSTICLIFVGQKSGRQHYSS